jgi:hypothetical protein
MMEKKLFGLKFADREKPMVFENRKTTLNYPGLAMRWCSPGSEFA